MQEKVSIVEMAVVITGDGELIAPAWTEEQDELASEAADQINKLIRRSATDIVNIGKILLRVKCGLPHGSYLPWLLSSFGWSERTAQHYVNVAINIGENAKHVSHLPHSTVYKLAAPGTPTAYRDDILGRLEGGEAVHSAEIILGLKELGHAAKKVRAEAKKTPQIRQKEKALKAKKQKKWEKEQEGWDEQRVQQADARTAIAALIAECLEDRIVEFRELLKVAGSINLHDFVEHL